VALPPNFGHNRQPTKEVPLENSLSILQRWALLPATGNKKISPSEKRCQKMGKKSFRQSNRVGTNSRITIIAESVHHVPLRQTCFHQQELKIS
jgi:hypothetical protein